MIALDAPIIPGVSAAGFHIGQFIERDWQGIGTAFVPEPSHGAFGHLSDSVRYRSDSVDLWVTNSVIQQIGVHGAYRGKLFDQISLGMTIDDIERLIGACMEEDEDKLAIAGVEGLCFDVAWRPYHRVSALDLRLQDMRLAPITWLFVVQSQAFVQYRLRTLHQAT
jgi:hypothetical protein